MTAVGSSVAIVAYLALFAGVGLVFLFVNLLVGRFVRPHNPHQEKTEIYECGEPTIGSSFVQFDLRFYVVALLFIIFDVEVAFFFPWATVFGKATHMADSQTQIVARAGADIELTKHGRALYREMGVRNPQAPDPSPGATPKTLPQQTGLDRLARSEQISRKGARQLAMITLVDIAVFFGVLMVGFFYVWKRGDLDWVRAVSNERSQRRARSPNQDVTQEPVLSA